MNTNAPHHARTPTRPSGSKRGEAGVPARCPRPRHGDRLLLRCGFTLAAMVLAGCGGGADSDRDASRSTEAGPADGASPPADGSRDGRTPPLPDASSTERWQWAPQSWEDCEGGGRMLEAGPDDYRSVLRDLRPGDTLRLRPGTYGRGMRLGVRGEEERCIVIEALDPSDPPRIQSGGSNVVDLEGVAWLKLRNLIVDSEGTPSIFGVALKTPGGPSHHVVIENVRFVGQGGSQQTVAISTKAPAWAWVIRGNLVEAAGTGMYLGNSDGRQPFVGGVIEFNTLVDPIGYGIQIKHQVAGSRDGIEDIPTQTSTVLRYNVVVKRRPAGSDGARPNVLLGHFPPSGAGSEDRYLVYGNFLYDNPSERLLQSDGSVALYANVLVNPHGDAVSFQRHNGRPRWVWVFLNTVLARGMGIGISRGESGFPQKVLYNAVFAAQPLRLRDGAEGTDNVVGDYEQAAEALVDPGSLPGEGLDLHPRSDASDTLMVPIDEAMLPDVLDRAYDYDGRQRQGRYAGAYDGPTDTASVPLTWQARPWR